MQLKISALLPSPRLRSGWTSAVLTSFLILTSTLAARAEIVVDKISPKFSVAGSLRTRWEGWNWFEPSGTQNNDYDFVGTVTRLSAKWKDDAFDVFVEAQNSALIDLPTTAAPPKAPAPQGPLGLGGVYFAHNRARNDASIFLKQGFVVLKQVGIPGLTLKGGRFEFSEGNEVLSGDPTVDWVKNMRVSQRLIGPFGWSHIGRAFDGGVISYNRSPLNFTVMASHPTQGGFDLNGMKEIDDIDLAYAGMNFTKLRADSTTDMRLFYIYYGDRRYQVKSDNRPAPVRSGADRRANIEIHTEGAHFIHAYPTQKYGTLDIMLWAAIQHGDWGVQDHQAWSWDTEIGWQPPKLPWKPWVRVGYGRSSGDDDAADDEHGTFFQILPTARIYAFSAFYNLMNSEDAFLDMLLRIRPGFVWRTEFHNIRLTEGRDLWYQGSGATLKDQDRAVGFGYPGRPARGERELFRVVQTSLTKEWGPYLNTNLYYGHVFGGAVPRQIYANKHADFGYLEFTLKF